MNLERGKRDELTDKYGTLYQGSVTHQDPRTDEAVEIEFIFRSPTHTDAERLISETRDSTLRAYRNLLLSIIVWPAPVAGVVQRLEQFPVAMTRFCDREIMPFFGEGAQVARVRLV